MVRLGCETVQLLKWGSWQDVPRDSLTAWGMQLTWGLRESIGQSARVQTGLYNDQLHIATFSPGSLSYEQGLGTDYFLIQAEDRAERPQGDAARYLWSPSGNSDVGSTKFVVSSVTEI